MTWTDCTATLLKLNERFVVPWLLSAVTTINRHTENNQLSLLSSLTPQENCSACSQVPQDLQFPPSAKLQEVLEYLTESASLWVPLNR